MWHLHYLVCSLHLRRHWRYWQYVTRHKRYVFIEGRKLHVPLWQLLVHDWTKLLPQEWFSYARTFRDPHGEKWYRPTEAFDQAWNSHEKRHKHHWQYWVLLRDTGELVPQKIEPRYLREMLADWRGAGLALDLPDTRAWYLHDDRAIMRSLIHPVSRQWIEKQLGVDKTEQRI